MIYNNYKYVIRVLGWTERWWVIEELASTSRAEQINAILLNTITQVVVLSKIL